jgi:hypothetical protein
MTLLIVLVLAQSAVFGAILFAGVKRLEQMDIRLGQMEDALAKLAEAPLRKRAARSEPAFADAETADGANSARASLGARARPGPRKSAKDDAGEDTPPAHQAFLSRSPPLIPSNDIDEDAGAAAPARMSPESMRTLTAASLFAAPALAAAFGAPASFIIAAIFMLVAAAFVASMRPPWRTSAWVGAVAGGCWAVAGLASGAAAAEPALFSGAALLAGAVGLAHARWSAAAWPGACLAILMAGAALALGADVGMVGLAGAAFAGIVLLAAIAGASALKLEAIHLAAFAAAGAGLFVLSGQGQGDVWFTPAAAWAGAAFGALAALRTPIEGARAALIAATGAIAPIFAVGVMINARHGLETPWAGAAAYAALALFFSGILAAALRRHGRLARLKLAAWSLGLAAAWCAGAAILYLIPVTLAPLQPSALALLGLGVIAIDMRLPARMWRFIAVAFTAFAGVHAWFALAGIGVTPSPMPTLLGFALALAAPAVLAGLAARFTRARAPISAALLEAGAMLAAAASLSALIRFAFSGSALWLTPIGFVETGLHAAAWLLTALLITMRAELGAVWARRLMAGALAGAGILLSIYAAILIPLGFWRTRLADPDTLAGQLPGAIGLAAPAVAAAALWFYFRRGDLVWPTHAARTAAAFLAAAFVTLQAALWRPDAEWIYLGLGAFSFAAAFAAALLPLRAVGAAPKPA